MNAPCQLISPFSDPVGTLAAALTVQRLTRIIPFDVPLFATSSRVRVRAPHFQPLKIPNEITQRSQVKYLEGKWINLPEVTRSLTLSTWIPIKGHDPLILAPHVTSGWK